MRDTAPPAARLAARTVSTKSFGWRFPGRESATQKVQQYKNRQGRRREHWILDSVPGIKGRWICVSRGSTITRFTAGDGCSQHTGCHRPHFQHLYWPCEGHMASVCINLHQRSAIRAGSGLIDPYCLLKRVTSVFSR